MPMTIDIVLLLSFFGGGEDRTSFSLLLPLFCVDLIDILI